MKARNPQYSTSMLPLLRQFILTVSSSVYNLEIVMQSDMFLICSILLLHEAASSLAPEITLNKGHRPFLLMAMFISRYTVMPAVLRFQDRGSCLVLMLRVPLRPASAEQ